MSNAIYPVLPGLTWDVKRKPIFQTKIQRSVGGKEVRAAYYTNPIWSYKLTYDVLRDGTGANESALAELQTIQAFFLQRQGAFDSFLFTDPNDNAVVAHGFGVGDGSTVGFQLQRSYLGVNQQDYWSGAKTSQFTVPRTNLALQSHGFSTATWTKTNLTDNGAVLAPDGTITARRYTATGTATLVQTVAGLTASSPYVDSVWLRCAAGTTIKLGTTEGTGASFALTTSWQRVPWAFTAAGASTVLTIGAGSSWGTGVIIEVWENQMESGSTPTPNITTAAAAVTVTPKYWPATGDGFEPIYNLNPATTLQVYKNGVLAVNGTDYTVNSAGLVTFATAPGAGVVLTWSGGYYWRVRFAQDEAEFNNFVQGLWDFQSVELVTVK